MDSSLLASALTALGDLLEARAQACDIVVIGGGALLLRGYATRVTRDLDAVALKDKHALQSAHPLPDYLTAAARDVARVLHLVPDWLNGGPTDLLRLGLPAGLLERVETFEFGALTVRAIDRYDQIHFKLYAAVDQGPRSKHVQDLMALKPTHDELQAAAAWCRTHDISQGFAEMLAQALQHLGEAALRDRQ